MSRYFALLALTVSLAGTQAAASTSCELDPSTCADTDSAALLQGTTLLHISKHDDKDYKERIGSPLMDRASAPSAAEESPKKLSVKYIIKKFLEACDDEPAYNRGNATDYINALMQKTNAWKDYDVDMSISGSRRRSACEGGSGKTDFSWNKDGEKSNKLEFNDKTKTCSCFLKLLDGKPGVGKLFESICSCDGWCQDAGSFRRELSKKSEMPSKCKTLQLHELEESVHESSKLESSLQDKCAR